MITFPFRSCLRAATAVLACCAASAAYAGDPHFTTPEAAAQYHAMAGELAALRQQPELAAQYFLKAVEAVPDATLAMRTTSLALTAKNEKLALKAARLWQSLSPDDEQARQTVVRLALRNGDRAETRTQCVALIKSHAGGPEEGFRQVAQLLSQEGDKQQDALAVMEHLRKLWPDLAGAWYAQSLLALRFNQLDLAENSARESLKLKPGAAETLLLLTGVLVKKGDLPAADLVFTEVLKDHADPAGMRVGYARLLLDAERLAAARQQYQAALDAKPDFPEARYALGLLALEQEDLDAAEPQFRALLTSATLKQPAAYYLGRIAETRKQYPEALAWYEQVTEGDQAIDAITRRAAVLSRMGELARSRALLADIRQEFPALATRFYLAEGDILLEANASEQALVLYQDALARQPDDADLLYGRSLVHERQQNFTGAEADLRNILSQNADDARAMNALGYMLTVRNERLPEARKLISRALELSPEDAAVMDSMGWVEFRQGKIKEARVLLEKAFAKVKDPEIAAHLGEVLWKLGDKQRAQEIWGAALAKEPEHRVLKETVERLAK